MKEKLIGALWIVGVPLVWLILGASFACTKSPTAPPPPPLCTSWKYMVLYSTPNKATERTFNKGGEQATSITPDEEQLNKLGEVGWELSTTYLEMETGFLSTGESLNTVPNVRPQRLVMVFKRLSCPK